MKTGWGTLKRDALKRIPTLRDSWRECFPAITDAMWQQETKDLVKDKHYANEMAVAAVASHTGIPIQLNCGVC
eukprot:3097734-Amphidinium_carterae.1